MSYSLVYSAKPSTGVLVYDQSTHLHNHIDTLKSCAKLIDAIFANAFKYKAPKRLHIKGRRYMYIPSDEYTLIRVKNFTTQ